MEEQFKPEQAWLLERLQDAFNDLPPMPYVINKIMEMTRVTNSKLEELARLIGSDQALSSKILRVVNSASIGVAGHVWSIRKAIYILGFDQVRSLALGLSVASATQSRDLEVFDVQRKAWAQSFARSTAAATLCKRCHLGVEESELIHTASLLNDIGRVFLLMALGRVYLAVAREAKTHDTSLIATERRLIGMPQSAFGKDLGRRWNFPSELIELIGVLDQESDEGSKHIPTQIIRLSDYMARVTYPTPLDSQKPRKDHTAMRLLMLSDSEVEQISHQVWSKTRLATQQLQAA